MCKLLVGVCKDTRLTLSRQFSAAAAIALVLLVILVPSSVYSFSIMNGRLIESNGNEFVIRGISHMHTWYSDRTTQTLRDIAATGANTVRIVLSNGGQWTRNSGSDVANVIQQCKDNQLICMLEVHDATGWGDEGGNAADAVHISDVVSYWISSDIKDAVIGQEDYVLVNIANEAFGNGVAASTYVNDWISAIQSLRTAGYTHTIVVDGANWGQDWESIMRDNAQQIFDGDPMGNTLFSIHMYEVYQNQSTVANYMQAFQDAGLPLIVGEFGADHQGNYVDADSIINESQSRSLGYIGWAWSGNADCCTALDMAINWDPNNLSTWGNRLINGSNGIAQTSQIATIFGGSPSPPSPPPPPTPVNDLQCSVSVNDWGDGFVASFTVTNNGSSTINGWSVDITTDNPISYNNFWSVNLSPSLGTSGTSFTGTNVSYNGNLAPGESVTFGMQGSPSPGSISCN